MAQTERRDSHWWLKIHRPHAHGHERRGSSAADYAQYRARTLSAPNAQYVPLDFTQNTPTDIPFPPFVDIEGVPNFRDLGGYACKPHVAGAAAGAPYAVRQGYVYRCSELSQITVAGTGAMVESRRIVTLFDFRSEQEGANPRGQPKGVHCISTPVFVKEDVTPAIAAQQLVWGTAPDKPKHAGFSQGYVDWYRQIAVYGAKLAFKSVFEHIRDEPDKPVVYHCSAGKDRTGVMSALILKLCGVDNATVAWEYALTVPGMGVWEAAVEQEMVGDSMLPVRSHGGMTREEAHRLCGSRASNMKRWLEVVLDGEFGGPAKYLRDHCHFTQADVDRIIQNLVVQGEATVHPVEVPGMEDHPQT